MNYAVVNNKGVVENIVSADSSVVEDLQHGLGMMLVCSEGFAVEIGDEYDIETEKFLRDGAEVPNSVTLQDRIDFAIDLYTMELIDGGVL